MLLLASLLKVILCLFVCLPEIKMEFSTPTKSTLTDDQIVAIADDIRLYRFAVGQEQIFKLKDNNKTAQIIHELYQHEEDALGILDFAKALTRVDLTFIVLRALRNEMVANGHRDPLKLIPLAKALEEDVVFQKNNDKIIKAESEKIIKEIKGDVKISATEILTKSMLENNYLLNGYTENVAKAIFNFFYDLNDEIMREMVNRTYPFVRPIQIVEVIMRSSKYIPQKVSVFLEVFDKLEKDNDLNNEAVLEIASCLKQLRDEKNYDNLFHNQKYDVNLMIDKIPTCARNLYFAEEICIWNRGKSEYLYAEESKNNILSERSVYTCAAENLKVGEGSWGVEKAFDDYQFKSQAFKKEYLSASMRKYDWVSRYVQIRENNFDDNINIVWKIELYGEYCFLKNQNINEYLVASDRKHSKRERYVFSASARANIDPIYFQWQIRDCS